MSSLLRRLSGTLELCNLVLVDLLGLPRRNDFRLDLQTSSGVVEK